MKKGMRERVSGDDVCDCSSGELLDKISAVYCLVNSHDICIDNIPTLLEHIKCI